MSQSIKCQASDRPAPSTYMQRKSSRAGDYNQQQQQLDDLGQSIGGPFEPAPWYISDASQTVDLYASLGYRSNQYGGAADDRSRRSSNSEAPISAPPPHTPPEKAAEYHREISYA